VHDQDNLNPPGDREPMKNRYATGATASTPAGFGQQWDGAKLYHLGVSLSILVIELARHGFLLASG